MARPTLFSTPRAHSHSLLAWAVLLPLFAMLAWFYLPVMQGDFVADDYVFIATSRMVDMPLTAFWQSHFYEPYYFRPIGVLSWWVLTYFFGLQYAAHSLMNVFLHMINTGLLLWLLRALTLRTSAVTSAVVLFALGPFALATILWPSNRFDLLACGFLLMQAIAMVRSLQGSVLAMPLATLAALAACWSKELAYPVATMMALLALAASGVPWRRRALLFALLGLAIGGAFLTRHYVLSHAYAIAGNDPVAQIRSGAATMITSLPRLTDLIVGTERATWFAWGVLGALLAALVWQRRDADGVNRRTSGIMVAALLVLLAAFFVQTPLAKNFALMLDGSSFGSITFARFYYAPWLAGCVLAALILARGQLGGIAAVTIIGVTIAAAMTSRRLPETFASWAQSEVQSISVAATKMVEEGGAISPSCVYVFLGTQAKHPYFRMFSDVTVKARTAMPDKVWRCYVMTESTPWLFAFPSSIKPIDLPLRTITDPNGAAKPDSVWGNIRYRYRLPAQDLAALPDARFFDWRDGTFVDVTAEVLGGLRKISSQDW